MGISRTAGKTIKEKARDIEVCREADVIVVGSGFGAALAIKDGVGLRAVNYANLQENLAGQGVPLPGTYATLSKA
jgi:hypothetical protein